jgi:hypothetical protein
MQMHSGQQPVRELLTLETQAGGTNSHGPYRKQ